MNPVLAKFLSIFIISKEKRKAFRKKHSTLVARYKKHHRKYHIGYGTYLGDNCHFSDKGTSVGKFCSISNNVSIGTTTHPTNFLSTHPFQYMSFDGLPGEIPEHNRKSYINRKPLHIGNDVWIGLNAVLMDGVNVGDGAIIGSQAVVTKDVPPYAIVAGVPARIIRYRFPEDVIAALLELRWWDLPLEQIRELPFDDVMLCIQKLRSIRQQEKSAEKNPDSLDQDRGK